MNKKRDIALISAAMIATLGLSGCQLLTGYQKIDEAESADAWAGQITPVPGEVNIACIGTYHCEITQIDQTLVIAPDTHKPVSPAMLVSMPNSDQGRLTPLSSKKSVKVVPLAESAMANLTNYYARVLPTTKREVHINFYPENNVGYVERFAMIHEFTQPGTYQLRAYRKKTTSDSGSLLETASPNPLCIDLIHNNTAIRRFCKLVDTDHQGEFVETKTLR